MLSERKWYWHIHHEILIEESWDVEIRRLHIKTYKSPKEIPLRLRLLKEVKSPVPYIPQYVGQYFGEMDRSYLLLLDHRDLIEYYHDEECKNCPWDGKTIFSNPWSRFKYRLKRLWKRSIGR